MNSTPVYQRCTPGLSPATDSRRDTGMSLVELLVVTTLAAILMGLGIPSYRYVTNGTRVSSEVNALLGDMTLARAEAIKEGQFVSVCPSSNGTSCTTSSDWSIGWIVFTDFNNNGTVDATDVTQKDTVVRYQPKFSGSDTFIVSNLNNNWVAFNRDGFATGLNSSANRQLLFSLDSKQVGGQYNTQWRRCLEVTFAGMMTTEHAGTGGCSTSTGSP